MPDIKNVKPKRKSLYKQGYINPSSCKKLFESCKDKPIIYRSSWEKIFCQWCEQNKNIEKWGSECISFKYISALDKKEHTYYPDFVLQMVSGETIIVEIKPYAQTQKPGEYASEYDKTTWLRNMSKWAYAKKWCESQENVKFWIVTEKTIHKLKI